MLITSECSWECLDLLLRLWGGRDDVDYRGDWLSVENGYSRPGPVRLRSLV